MVQPSKLRCLQNYILMSHDCLAFVSNLELKWNTIKVNYKHTALTWLMQIGHLKVTHNHNNFRLGMCTTSQLIVAIVTTRCQKLTGSQCWCGNNPNSEFGPFAELVPSHIQVSVHMLQTPALPPGCVQSVRSGSRAFGHIVLQTLAALPNCCWQGEETVFFWLPLFYWNAWPSIIVTIKK